jgi:predicted esterase
VAAFVAGAATHHGFDGAPVVAVGFSNGANMAASLLLLEPGVLAAAVLFRAMVPIVPDPLPSLPGTPVLIANGRTDPLVTPEDTERLAALLREAGANVTLDWDPAGHLLTAASLARAAAWLARLEPAPRKPRS